MKILLYSEFCWDRLGPSYARAFEGLGCEVVPFDSQKIREHLGPLIRNRIIHRLTIHSYGFRRRTAHKWNRRFLDAVASANPDVVLILKGDFLLADTIRAIRRSRIPVFIFHPDNPFPPHPDARPETIRAIAESDVYFIWSRSLVEPLYQSGAKRVEYLPFGWDPLVFPSRDGLSQIGEGPDVVFIGSWDPSREAWLSPVARDFDLKIWGSARWKTHTKIGSPLRDCWQGGEVRAMEAARIYRSAKISLNVLVPKNSDGTNMRTFEIPGSGGFALATRTVGANEVFPEDEAGAYFSGADELMEQIRRYLVDEQSRQAIRTEAHRIVASNHTYVARANHILEIYNGLFKKQ